MNFYDLDDDDEIIQSQHSEQNDNSSQEENNNSSSTDSSNDDYVVDFLKTRGIEDPSKIMFEDENNQLVERNWNDLTKEEKLNILNTPLGDDSNNLTDEEVDLLSQIRQSNMTPSEYIKQLSGGEVIQQPVYRIEDLSDDEVYLLDLESRVGDLSDEQAAQALSIAKQQDEELFKKQIEGIRKEYKEREDFKNQQAQAQLEQEQQEAYNIYYQNVVNAIGEFDSIGNLGLDFDNSDKDTLAEFMLGQDESGKNYLNEALQDPETLTRAAWFILNGEEALNSIADYYNNQIKLVAENQYKKGLEDGKKGTSNNKSEVVITQQEKRNPYRQFKTIEDLDDED